jgi:alpha-tubulin suppressor-like RCC1 family protein
MPRGFLFPLATLRAGAGVLFSALVFLSFAPITVAVPVAELTVVRPVVAGQSVSASLNTSGISGTPVYTIADEPAQGSVTLDDATTGAFTYTANPDANGRDTFTFQVTDDDGTSELQDVYLTVHPHGRRVLAVGNAEDARTDVSDWSDIVAVGAALVHTVGLRSDGTVVAVGEAFGQTDVGGWSNIVAVAAGGLHTVGLQSDGTVVAVGDAGYGQTNISGWSNIVAVAAGYAYTVGLQSDGTVVAVGDSGKGQTEISGWSNIVAVAAGSWHTVGLQSDGTVVAVGQYLHGATDVGDWNNIVAVAAGDSHTVGLKSDGTVVAVGYGMGVEGYGTDVSSWNNIVALTAAGLHTVGLQRDGTVVAVGRDLHGATDVSDWSNIVAVAAGSTHTVGLQRNAAPTFVSAPALMGSPGVGQTLRAANIDVTDDDDDAVTLTYQWQRSPDNVSFADITDAVGNSYTLAADDAHAYVRVVVTADDTQPVNHSSSCESAAVYQNAVPLALDDANVIDEGGPVIIDVLANDSDADGDMLTVSGAPATTARGATVVSHGTHITYTPAPGWSGIDSFSYVVSDGHGGTATAKVMIGVVRSAQSSTSRITFNGGGGFGAEGMAMLALLVLRRRWRLVKQD